ncbi:MAG TPA: DUF1488 domain-containing protein [Dongiaceae bacterium]|nr:DUF1488 domain-containing protein [Dongiaceae bacterium]
MSLTFPNQSRSYDSTRNRVRFWAHDEALEISFFVDAEIFCRANSSVQPNEAAVLDAFDQNRERICAMAKRIYTRHERGSYSLTAADCKEIAVK